jgi:hypothetical protein
MDYGGIVMGKAEGDRSLFLQFFGDKPKFRIMDFMLENRLSDFTKTEIAKGAGLSWAALYSYWDELERKRIVKITRTVGRAKLYQLNEDSPLVKLLMNIEATIISEAADIEEEEMKIKVKVPLRRK